MKCNVNRFNNEEAINLATKIIEETVRTIDFEEDVKHLLAIQQEGNSEHTMILLCCLCFDKVNNLIDLRKIKDKIYSTSGSNMDLNSIEECLVVTLLRTAWEFLVDYTDKQIEFDKKITKAFFGYSSKAIPFLDKAGLQ